MKKTVQSATLLASMTFALTSIAVGAAPTDSKTTRMPAAIDSNVVPVACQFKDMECVISVRSYTEDREDGQKVEYSYCAAGGKVVSGKNLNFCVIPKPAML